MGNTTSKQKASIAPSISNGSTFDLLRAKSKEVLPRSYTVDWTIDRHRLTRQYLIFGMVRKWEKNILYFEIPKDISLTIFLFYYLGHRERFECHKDLDPDKQIIYIQDDDINDRKDTVQCGTLIIDSLLSQTKHVWIFRIMEKNCCSIAIGITEINHKLSTKKPIYSCCSNGTKCYVKATQTTPNYREEIDKFDLKYSWGSILIMELDLSSNKYATLSYGVKQETLYKDYESVIMRIGFKDIKKEKNLRMAVWMKGYEARVQLLEYFEDDNEMVTKQVSESFSNF